jgi:hypothetical protein
VGVNPVVVRAHVYHATPFKSKQRPEHHGIIPFELNAGAGNRTTPGPRPTYTKAENKSAELDKAPFA